MLSTRLSLLFATILVGSKMLGSQKFVYMTFKNSVIRGFLLMLMNVTVEVPTYHSDFVTIT